MAAFYHLIIDQGANLREAFTYKDSDGVAVNLTGYTARSQVRATHASSSAVLSTTSAAGTLVITENTGTITFAVAEATTAALVPANYVWDLEIISAAGVVTRLIGGTCTVTPEVTR